MDHAILEQQESQQSKQSQQRRSTVDAMSFWIIQLSIILFYINKIDSSFAHFFHCILSLHLKKLTDFNVQIYAKDIPKMCQTYAKYMSKICQRYAKDM